MEYLSLKEMAFRNAVAVIVNVNYFFILVVDSVFIYFWSLIHSLFTSVVSFPHKTCAVENTTKNEHTLLILYTIFSNKNGYQLLIATSRSFLWFDLKKNYVIVYIFKSCALCVCVH